MTSAHTESRKEQTMRLIDGDALIVEPQKDEVKFDKEADDCRKNAGNYTDCYMQAMSSRADGIRDAIVEVYDAPSIDLVRCAECKSCKRKRGTFKGEPIIFYRCEENNRDVESDDYCSWGERSE